MRDNFPTASSSHRRLIIYAFKAKDGRPDWEAFDQYLSTETHNELTDWQLDLREIEILDSLSLGNLIATNARLARGGGRVNLLVKTNSAVERLLHAAKLERLMPMTMVT
jgi:anti-anti-sigma factor